MDHDGKETEITLTVTQEDWEDLDNEQSLSDNLLSIFQIMIRKRFPNLKCYFTGSLEPNQKLFSRSPLDCKNTTILRFFYTPSPKERCLGHFTVGFECEGELFYACSHNWIAPTGVVQQMGGMFCSPEVPNRNVKPIRVTVQRGLECSVRCIWVACQLGMGLENETPLTQIVDSVSLLKPPPINQQYNIVRTCLLNKSIDLAIDSLCDWPSRKIQQRLEKNLKVFKIIHKGPKKAQTHTNTHKHSHTHTHTV